MTDSSEKQDDIIAALTLHREIEEQVNRYARSCDECDWQAWETIFDPDVVADFGPSHPPIRGFSQLSALLRGVREKCSASQHLVGNLTVSARGSDMAESRFYLRGFHRGMGEREAAIWDTMGEYSDVWKRGPDGWRIVNRRHVMHAMVGTLEELIGPTI